jgi:ankyrin repeat protein
MDLLDGEGQAPLHKAVMYNQLEAVQVLAMNGINLNIKDAAGNTALHVREKCGNCVQCCRLLWPSQLCL